MNAALLAFGALDARLATGCRLLSLYQYELLVRIGVHDFERRLPQRMWFDVDLCVPLEHAPAASDHIAHTLDYDFIRQSIRDIVGQTHHYELQETLCDAILVRFMAHPHIQAVRVRTCKPDVYPDCQSVGTERVGIKPW
jgi:dihydroneopterin aldolase